MPLYRLHPQPRQSVVVADVASSSTSTTTTICCCRQCRFIIYIHDYDNHCYHSLPVAAIAALKPLLLPRSPASAFSTLIAHQWGGSHLQSHSQPLIFQFVVAIVHCRCCRRRYHSLPLPLSLPPPPLLMQRQPHQRLPAATATAAAAPNTMTSSSTTSRRCCRYRCRRGRCRCRY